MSIESDPIGRFSVFRMTLNQFCATKQGKRMVESSMWWISLPLAFLTPDNILEYDLIGRYVRFMLNTVPMIYKVQALSPIPNIAKFYFAVMWTIMPIWIYLYFKVPDEIFMPFEKAQESKTLLVFGSIFLMPIAMLIAYTLPGTSSGLSGAFRVMLGSRFGLGFLGVCVPLMIPFGLRYFVAWYRYFPRLCP